MGFLKDLFGANQSVPTYDVNAAKDMYLWTQRQGRYNVDNGKAKLGWDSDSNTLRTTYGADLQNVLGTLFGGTNADQQAADSVYNAFSDRYEPTFERQTNNLADRLKNQGIPVGSEAYTKAMNDLGQTQNDARRQAAYQSVLAGQQARNNEIQNNLSLFNAFNPLNGYTGTSAQGNSALYDNLYNSQVNQASANAANKTAWAKGLWGLGMDAAQTAATLLSDGRIKENLREVGRLYNGLPVYLFNFKGDTTPRLGLIAQEVEQVYPQAVTETAEGLKMVNYAAASVLPEQNADEQGEKYDA